ncbi:MAG: hypothetical protein ACLUFV_07020 [Acutalibacteraceae bacterium]
MKKAFILLLCLLLALGAAACGNGGDESSAPAGQSAAESSEPAEDSSAPAEEKTPSERYDALMARLAEEDVYLALEGEFAGMEMKTATARRDGVLCTKSEMLGAVSYVVVKDGKSYSFDLTEPVYIVSDEEESTLPTDDTVFVSEGTEELDGKTYDCVVRAAAEDETQTMTFFFDGDALYAIRYTMALGDTTVDSLFSVTALSDEIPDDMLFDIPEGYTEYSFSDDDTSVNENAKFPSELPEFTAGTLMMAEEVGGEYTFAYADTTQADCDAYIAALTADGFTDVGWRTCSPLPRTAWSSRFTFPKALRRSPTRPSPKHAHSAFRTGGPARVRLFVVLSNGVLCGMQFFGKNKGL